MCLPDNGTRYFNFNISFWYLLSELLCSIQFELATAKQLVDKELLRINNTNHKVIMCLDYLKEYITDIHRLLYSIASNIKTIHHKQPGIPE